MIPKIIIKLLPKSIIKAIVERKKNKREKELENSFKD